MTLVCLFVKPYLAISGETKALILPFPLTQDSENRLTSVFTNTEF